MTRRTFLADLGRVSLAAVVLGPVLGACDADDDAAGGTGGADDGPDGTAAAASPSASATATPAASWQRASFGFVSAYVLVRDGEAVLFDTGTGDGPAPLVDALGAAGADWSDVAHVLVSHEHGDHVGGLAAVAAEAPDATVHAAMPDLDVVRAQVSGAAEVVDGDEVGWLRVVATPGHTPGHVAALEESTGVLLAGDAIVNGVAIGGTSGDGIEVSPPDFTADADQARASVGVLAGLRPTTILFGHGEPITEDAASLLTTYADTL